MYKFCINYLTLRAFVCRIFLVFVNPPPPLSPSLSLCYRYKDSGYVGNRSVGELCAHIPHPHHSVVHLKVHAPFPHAPRDAYRQTGDQPLT